LGNARGLGFRATAVVGEDNVITTRSAVSPTTIWVASTVDLGSSFAFRRSAPRARLWVLDSGSRSAVVSACLVVVATVVVGDTVARGAGVRQGAVAGSSAVTWLP